MANLFSACTDEFEVVFQAVGAGSVCWEQVPAGVFDSTRAKRVGEDAMERLAQLRGESNPPHIAGSELLRELNVFTAET